MLCWGVLCSFGILMLQMAFPNLRSDNSLIAFNRRLQELGWDLKVCAVEGGGRVWNTSI